MSALRERKTDLTIIIPVYNLEAYITPMLESLKAQDFGGYTVEILIVLNNCTDNTELVIRQSGLHCTLLDCTTQGCGPARNTGLDAAHGEYIWMLDGDDWLLSNTAVHDALDRVYADNLNILYIPLTSQTFTWQYFSMVCQYMIRREFIGDTRFPNYQPAEDDAFMQTILARAGVGRYTYHNLPHLDEPLYYYNYGRPGSNMMRYYSGEKI